jgi:hypothetical protein
MGSLGDLLGESWLADLMDQGVTIYDYRPSGGNGGAQTFLVHYKLDMDSSEGFDFSEYKDMMDGFTRDPTDIDPVKSEVPSVNNKVEEFDVEISMAEVTKQIDTITKSMPQISNAYLPVQQGSRVYSFPDSLKDPEFQNRNDNKDFSVTLNGLTSLTLKDGRLKFNFSLIYNAPSSSLVLSNFGLRGEGQPLPNVRVEGSGTVTLDGRNSTGSVSLNLNGVTLPKKFDLVCSMRIAGNTAGYIELKTEPAFEGIVVSGAEDLVLTSAQIASLNYNFPERKQEIGGNLGPSFVATVETGNLQIDTSKLFPNSASPAPDGERWNLTLNLAGLRVRQERSIRPHNKPGLALGGSEHLLFPGDNDLRGEKLNHNNVVINGMVTANVPDNKLTFYIPGGIPSTYERKMWVRTNVSLFSEVTVLPKDFGLDKVDQEKEQKLGDDFSTFKEWLNYIQFPQYDEEYPDRGIGVALEIKTLNVPDGMGLFIDAPAFGLNNVFRRLEKQDPAPAGGLDARLIFINQDDGGYRLLGKDIPEKSLIKVSLGWEDANGQYLAKDREMTMRNVVPGSTIKLEGAQACTLFGWEKMSIKPKEHTRGDDDPLPTYPFEGTFPEGGDGMDLSDMAKGLVLSDGAFGARLYISLEKEPEDGSEWKENLKVALPNLEFKVKYDDGEESANLFTHVPGVPEYTEEWALSSSLGKILEDMADPENAKYAIVTDTENKDNPFKIYTASGLPEPDKGIPIENLGPALNRVFSGEKGGSSLSFRYNVELASVENKGIKEPGEILLYPAMLEKTVKTSADLLMLVSMKFQVKPHRPDNSEAPVILEIDADLGDEDIFGRGEGDNGFFDNIKFLGFEISSKNAIGLSAGKLYLENTHSNNGAQGAFRREIFDFVKGGNLLLNKEDLMENNPFIPKLSLEFKYGDTVEVGQSFAIKLQSITVRVGGEYTFETGL